VLRLIEHTNSIPIYHEHFSYFSMCTTVRILDKHGLRVFDVEELALTAGRCAYSPAAPRTPPTTRSRVFRKCSPMRNVPADYCRRLRRIRQASPGKRKIRAVEFCLRRR